MIPQQTTQPLPKNLQSPPGLRTTTHQAAPILERVRINRSLPMPQAVRVLDQGQVGILVITDDAGALLGTLTDGDIRRAILAGRSFECSAAEFLRGKDNPVYPEPIWLPNTASRRQMLALMTDRKIRHLPLLDERYIVTDLVRIEDLQTATTTQPPTPLAAVIMAGGLGTRLYPLTKDTPKPMLPVGGKPLLERTIANLRDAGVQEVVVSTRFKAEIVEDHFNDGAQFGVSVKYLNENQPLGTAGSLRLMQRPTDTLLVINGDVLTSLDFRAMRAFHKEHNATLTVGVRKYEFSVPYGVVDCQGPRVTQLREKPTYTSFVNAGIYLLEPQAFDHLPESDTPFNMTDLIEKLVAADNPVVSFPIHEYWMDIGQHEDYKAVQRDVAAGLAG